MALDRRMRWSLDRFSAGYCTVSKPFLLPGTGNREYRKARCCPVKQDRLIQEKGQGYWRGKRCAGEFHFLIDCKYFPASKGKSGEVCKVKPGVFDKQALPWLCCQHCRQAMQFLWHRIAVVSWWRSFQSLSFPVLSWQQLLSRACWSPFSHAVNAMHRKVGCSHLSPSLSEICLIESREGHCTSVDLANFPWTWQRDHWSYRRGLKSYELEV